MKNTPITLFWFRRDLRLTDNVGLHYALKENKNVLPIFIFDTEILDSLPKDDARVTFIYNTLHQLKQTLEKKYNSTIHLYNGTPYNVFKKIIATYSVKAVYTNTDYEPYAIQRDNRIEKLLQSHGIAFKSYKDQVIFHKNQIVKQDGSPYIVYTPYMKAWKQAFTDSCVYNHDINSLSNNFYKNAPQQNVTLKELGFKQSKQEVQPYTIHDDLIENYAETRDFPALNGTSKLSPHLRFGTVSIRQVVKKAYSFKKQTFLNELIWREFFMQILWHFPDTVHKSFKPQYDAIQWRNNEKEFELWCKGKTGYPLVDAGMRELNQTGYMHNRVRMVVGSFLCKHLLIDWRWGEAYFAQKLLDYEMASNVGNWQWVAGCGVDAAPYFRIFNPTTQLQKFDKNLNYIKKWVPEFQELTYPTPIVDHKKARERCLKVYKEALQQ